MVRREKEGSKEGRPVCVYDYMSKQKGIGGHHSRLSLLLRSGKISRLYVWRLEIRGGNRENSLLRTFSTCRRKK